MGITEFKNTGFHRCFFDFQRNRKLICSPLARWVPERRGVAGSPLGGSTRGAREGGSSPGASHHPLQRGNAGDTPAFPHRFPSPAGERTLSTAVLIYLLFAASWFISSFLLLFLYVMLCHFGTAGTLVARDPEKPDAHSLAAPGAATEARAIRSARGGGPEVVEGHPKRR